MGYEIKYDRTSEQDNRKACMDAYNFAKLATYKKLVDLCKMTDRSHENMIRVGFMFAGIQGYPVDAMMQRYKYNELKPSKQGNNTSMWDKTKSIKRIPIELTRIVEEAVVAEIDVDNMEAYFINNPAKSDWTLELNKSNVSVTITMIDDDNDLGEERWIDEEFLLEEVSPGKYRFTSLDE